MLYQLVLWPQTQCPGFQTYNPGDMRLCGQCPICILKLNIKTIISADVSVCMANDIT